MRTVKRWIPLVFSAFIISFFFSTSVEAQTVQKKYYVDLGGDTSQTAGWNNIIDGAAGVRINNLIDSNGGSSNISLEIKDSFWNGWIGAYNGNGTTQSALYPASATQDSLFVGDHLGSVDNNARVQLGGLNPNATYAIRLFGSRMTDDQISDRTTIYTINGVSKELQARNNNSNYAEFTNVTTASGTLDISVTLKAGAIYGYLGVIELTETGGTTPTQPTNPAPVVNAGPDQSVAAPATNALIGPGSSMSDDGAIITSLWSQVSGPAAATIQTPNTAWTWVSNLISGTYIFRLSATDNGGVTGSDEMKVTVSGAATTPTNQSPTVNAGADKTITLPTSNIALFATWSDSDGSIVSSQWSQVSGPTTAYGLGTTQSIDVSNLTKAGTYVFRLTVTDNGGLTATDDVQVTVNPAATQPTSGLVVTASADQTIVLPTNFANVSVSVSDTSDAVFGYWSQVSGPSTAAILTPYMPWTTRINNLVAGTYVFRATFLNKANLLSSDDVVITVATSGGTTNTPPTVGAGADQTITLPTNAVLLYGSATDAQGDAMTYAWTKVSGGSATFSSTTALNTGVSGLVQGTYVFRLTATDSKGAASSDDVQITVNGAVAANIPPTANAGADKVITLPTNFTSFTGTGTDTDGTITSYAWTKVSGTGTIATPTAASTSITGLSSGVSVFRLTVTDNKGATGFDDVQVTVNAAANIPPSANAGNDQIITLPTSTVTLSGSGNDTDGTIASYSWTKVSGTGVITTPTAASTTVTGLTQGTSIFRLIVTDNSGATAGDDVTITVNAVANLAPVVNAGADLNVPSQSNTVALLDQTVTDPEGKATTYAWSQVSGPSTAKFYSVSWAPPVVYNLVQGTYVFRLTGTDDLGATATDDVTVTLSSSTGTGSPFMRTITQKSLVSNGVTIHYYESLPRGYNTDTTRKWPVIIGHHGIGERGATADTLPISLGASVPIKNAANLEFNNESFIVLTPQLSSSYSDWQTFYTQAMIDYAKANLRVDTDRIYLLGFSLGSFGTWVFPQASDANAQQIAAIVPISGGRNNTGICRLATNKVPVWAFHATNDSVVGVGTTDTAINALNACSPAPSPAPKYTRYTTGDHWILSTATDPNAPSASNIYNWLLSNRRAAAANVPPTANAGADQTITLPTSSLTLTGSGTDVGGTITAYSWSKVSGGSATIASPTSATTNLAGLVQGTYIFRLTVTDNAGATASDDVQITVNAASTGTNTPAARTLTAKAPVTVPLYYNQALGYYESLPKGYDNDLTKKWPAIIFLHGIGERGNGTTELTRVLGQGLPAQINSGAQLEYNVNGQNQSFVVLMPQLLGNNGDWHPYHVDRFVELAKTNYRVDPNRIYVTGLSLGGFGTMRYAEFSDAFAKKIAALVPSDGGNNASAMYTPDATGGYNAPLDRCHIARNNIPVWGIYGLNDATYGPSLTQDIAGINACSPAPNPLAIINGLANTGHSAWNTTYKPDNSAFNPNIYQWLLTKSRP